MTTPQERAVTAVSKILAQAVAALRVLEQRAHESDTMVLARTAADVVDRYIDGL